MPPTLTLTQYMMKRLRIWMPNMIPTPWINLPTHWQCCADPRKYAIVKAKRREMRKWMQPAAAVAARHAKLPVAFFEQS